MLVVVIVTILIIISVGIFMVYRPRPTTESEKLVVTETIKPPMRSPGRRKFPKHWGPEPENQKRDNRELPGGYGFGSTTLALWIMKNMAADNESEKTEQPVDCVGKWGEWSPCSAGSTECEGGIPPVGTQKRNWITLKKAKNGGKACVYDINKDGFKACKGVCNKDVQICYSCGYKNCKVFKIGIYKTPLNGVRSIKVPYGRKADFWYRRPGSQQVVRSFSRSSGYGGAGKNCLEPIQIVDLRITKK